MKRKSGYGIIIIVVLIAVFGYIIVSALQTRNKEFGEIRGIIPQPVDREEPLEKVVNTVSVDEIPQIVPVDSTETVIEYKGTVLAGTQAQLLDFHKDDYEQALQENKLIVLYFYANWCPTCKTEITNSLYSAFHELKTENVVGFRINYKDNETDSDERDIAREFGVGYQHTKVFLKNGVRVLKAPDSWDKDRYLREIRNFI